MRATRLLAYCAAVVCLFLLPLSARAQDADGDGMPDLHELLYPCLKAAVNDATVDYDSDGMSSLQEYQHSPLLNPCDWDTDNDLLWDGGETNIFHSNPLLSDTDGDELFDGVEVYDFATDPTMLDTDSDAMDDGWEVDSLSCGVNPLLNDATADSDTDALNNLDEFAAGTNPCQADTDGDLMPDGWENSYACLDPLIGDSSLDIDLDGFANLEEFTRGSNPCVSDDTDSDGMPNAWEMLHACLLPNTPDANIDFDQDGKTSLQEYQFDPGLDPCDPDTDADGDSDGLEINWGSNPLNNRFHSSCCDEYGNDIRITFDTYTNSPAANYEWGQAFLWTGSEYGVAWADSRYGGAIPVFRRISADGRLLGPEKRVATTTSESNEPSLAWTGSEYGIAMRDSRNGLNILEIYFSRLTADGDTIIAEKRITYNGFNVYPAIAWNGSEFGMIRRRNHPGGELVFNRIDALGNLIGADVRMDAHDDAASFLVWTGSEYGVCWKKSSQINFTRISATGVKQGASKELFVGATTPNMIWNGSQFGFAYVLSQDIYFATLTASGNTVGPSTRLTNDSYNSAYPKLSWTGSQYGIVWQDNRDETGFFEIYFAALDRFGTKISQDRRITSWTGYSRYPLIAWSGSDFGVKWFDWRDGNQETYFARIVHDKDGDGLWKDDEDLGYGTNSSDWDTDNDLMDDKWEVTIGGVCGINALMDDAADDADGDGASNFEEYVAASDPCQTDTDGDGLSDGAEMFTLDTDPLDTDTDNDGWTDGEEVNYWDIDPTVFDLDSDLDGFPDEVETNTGLYLDVTDTGTDPNSFDSDSDGTGDWGEVFWGSNPSDDRVHPNCCYETGDDVRVTFDTYTQTPSASYEWGHALVWNGSEYGIGWADLRYGGVYATPFFNRISANGSLLGPEKRVAVSSSHSTDPSIAWTGSEYGVATYDMRNGSNIVEIYFTRLNVDGDTLGVDKRITYTGYSLYPTMVWNGSEYGLIRRRYHPGGELVFTRVDPLGNMIGADVLIDSHDDAASFLVWTGSEYGTCWKKSGQINFARISATGVKQGASKPLFGATSTSPNMIWNGSKFSFVYAMSQDIYFATVTASGNTVSPSTRLTNDAFNSAYPTLAWTGSEFGVAWQDNRDETGFFEIYFAALDKSGNKISQDLRVTSSTGYSRYPLIVWSGSEFGIEWSDWRDGNQENYFTRLTPDWDGDGLWSEDEVETYGTNPHDWDTDHDLTPDKWEMQYSFCGLNPLIANIDADPDLDQLTNAVEYGDSTNPCGYNDSDSDGMPDGWERKGAACGLDEHLNDASSDPDLDSYTNLQEYQLHTDPCISDDTDGDGVDNAWESAHACMKVNQFDSGLDYDSDGLTNLEEYQYSKNLDPCDPDTDNDGLWDGEEVDELLTDPLLADTDADGMNDFFEAGAACIDPTVNDALLDGDLDGLGNYNEYNQGLNPCHTDSDGDGAPDGWEYGFSYCGLDPGLADALLDADGDGISNLVEYQSNSNPCEADTDGDGMPDNWENWFDLDSQRSDAAENPDGDALTNLQEYLQGKNPRSAEDAPTSTASSSLTYTNAPIPIAFTQTDSYATVTLWSSYAGGPYAATSYSQAGGAAGSLLFTPQAGDGWYSFYTIASISPQCQESPPETFDAKIGYDTVYPISFVDVADYSNGSMIAVGWNAFDTFSGVDSVELLYRRNQTGSFISTSLVGMGPSGTLTFDPSALGDGIYEFFAIATDQAGNVEPMKMFTNVMTVVDSTPPIAALVVSDDGNYSRSSSMLHATWTAADDAESGIVRYDYAIGTSAGSADVLGWTSAGNGLEAARFGLSLQSGQTYFIGVRAVNGAGLISDAAWSDGIMVDSTSPAVLSSSPAHREVANDFLALPVNLPVTLRLGDLGAGIDWSSLAVVLDFTTIAPGAIVRDGSTITFTSPALNLGNHVINVVASDLAGNDLFQNIIFVVEDPAKVIINPVSADWRPGDPALTFTADGGTGNYTWIATGGTLDVATGATVHFTPNGSAGSFTVAVSDAKLVSAMADVNVRGAISLAPAVTRLNPGDTVGFVAGGGSGPFGWTVAGGSCALSGSRSERCLFTAGGSDGEYSLTAAAGADSFTSRVIITGSVGRAIIVVGGGLVDENRQVAELSAMGKLAYETLLRRGFSRDQIQYLDPDPLQSYDGDGDGLLNDIDGSPTPAALQGAITNWATTDLGVDNPPVGPTVPLIVYFVDHGAPGSFLINYNSSGVQQLVSATDVDSWLDTAQGTGAKAVLIYDACFSGSFLAPIGAGGANRIVVASSAADKSAYFAVNGTVSFSQFFWAQVRQNLSVGAAFNQARLALASWSGQDPQLDDNGDGVYLTTGVKDGTVAGNFKIGAPFVAGSAAPALVPCGDVALQAGSPAEMCSYLNGVDHEDVASVIAIITPPGYEPPPSAGDFKTPGLNDKDGHPLPRVHLDWDQANGRMSHTFDAGQVERVFSVNGQHTATLFARDKQGDVSARSQILLTIFGPDEYEDDDQWRDASTITINAPAAQTHNFHDVNDYDWVRIEIVEGGTYRFFTENLAALADTTIYLYGPSAGDNEGEFITMDDDSGAEARASEIVVYLDPGTYYMEVSEYDWLIFGEGTNYDLRAERETLGVTGSVEGFVTDAGNGFALPNTTVKLTCGASVLSNLSIAGGYYLINAAPAGACTLSVTRANYNSFSQAVTVTSGTRLGRNVALVPKVSSGLITGTVTGGGSPLAGVSLTIGGYAVMTGVDGKYWVRVNGGTTNNLSARATGYLNYTASGIYVGSGATTTYNFAMTPVPSDSDGDGLVDTLEAGWCTSPSNADTDGDGINDGGPTGEDRDADGVVDATETNPCDADSDVDGLNDGLEDVTIGSDALYWDTDGDGLPDKFEYDNRTGHTQNLDILLSADGAENFDADTNTNAHEYWNGTDPWSAQPTGGAGCNFWGDGDGDGIISPSDKVPLSNRIKGITYSYTTVIPTTGETQDLDQDGFYSPSDLAYISMFIKQSDTGSLASRPTAVTRVEPAVETIDISEGMTTHVLVRVANFGGQRTPGIGVGFEVDASSTGTATVFGGEGLWESGATGGGSTARFDITDSVLNGYSRVVIRVNTAGTIRINAVIPGCGSGTLGRSCPNISTAPVVTITGH